VFLNVVSGDTLDKGIGRELAHARPVDPYRRESRIGVGGKALVAEAEDGDSVRHRETAGLGFDQHAMGQGVGAAHDDATTETAVEQAGKPVAAATQVGWV
jgi:hypothetical protein